MALEIFRNDITLVTADAIVNTANPLPIIGAGTDSAIHSAAGPELLKARQQLGELAVGQSAETPAYGLNAKYVLHTVSPAWIDGAHGEPELLRCAYDSALERASALHCASVAFPLMAAGSYAFPLETALSVAIAAFTDYLLEHEDMTIFLVLFNSGAFDLAGSLFSDLKSYVDDRYVDLRHQSEYSHHSADRRRKPKGIPADESVCFSSVGNVLPDAIMHKPTRADDYDGLEGLLRSREETFSEHLLSLLKERDGKDSEVYKRAEISRQLFSKILSDRDYQPTKRTAIQLAIGLQLNVPQTQKLLETAGFVLTRSSRADLVVQYFIEKGIYNVTIINVALSDSGLPLLKTGLQS